LERGDSSAVGRVLAGYNRTLIKITSNILGFSSLTKISNLLNKHVNTVHLLGGVMQRHLKILSAAYLWILGVESNCLSLQHKNCDTILKYHSRGTTWELDVWNL
jgi:hypothetical protein